MTSDANGRGQCRYGRTPRKRVFDCFAPAVVEGLVISDKIRRQMGPRGWTEQLMNEAVQTGQRVATTTYATGAPATRYIHPGTGQFIVVEDATRIVIQVGGKGFIPSVGP